MMAHPAPNSMMWLPNEDAAVAAIMNFVAASDEIIEVVELLSPSAVARLGLSHGEVRLR